MWSRLLSVGSFFFFFFFLLSSRRFTPPISRVGGGWCSTPYGVTAAVRFVRRRCVALARGEEKRTSLLTPPPPLGVSSPPSVPASFRFVRTERRGRDRDRTPETNTRQSARRFAADGQYVYVQHRVVVALVGPPRTSSPPPPHTVSLSLPSSSSRSRFKVQGSRLVLRSIVSDVH